MSTCREFTAGARCDHADRAEARPAELPSGSVVIPAPRADGVLGLSGEFDWSGPGGALSALVRSYRGNARVVVDMAGVRYMDHRVLLALDEGAGAAGVLMLVRSAPPTVARLVGLLALDHLRIEAEAARR